MATDATGTPTTLGIPKFLTSADAPSGNGGNAQMDSIDALIQARVNRPAGVASGDVPVWNGATFVVPTGSRNGLKFLRDDGSYNYPLNQTLYRAGGNPLFTVSGLNTDHDLAGVDGTGVAIPGGVLGTANIVRFWVFGHFFNNSGGAVNFTPKVGYGGVLGVGGGYNIATSATNRTPFVITGQIQGAGSTGTQLLMATIILKQAATLGQAGTIPQGFSGTPPWIFTTDSTVSQNLRITMANDNGAGTVSTLVYASTVEVV